MQDSDALLLVNPDLVLGFAEAATGRRGYEAMRAFAKQLIIGASRDEGAEDLTEVFSKDLLEIFGLRVLTNISFSNEARRYRWVFSEQWVQDPDEWAARGCSGLILVGMDDDAEFFFLEASEASDLLQEWNGVLTVPQAYEGLTRWADQWRALLGGQDGTVGRQG